jgi:hypothetical protein
MHSVCTAHVSTNGTLLMRECTTPVARVGAIFDPPGGTVDDGHDEELWHGGDRINRGIRVVLHVWWISRRDKKPVV